MSWRKRLTYEGRYQAFLIEACEIIRMALLTDGRSAIAGQSELARRLGCSPWYLNKAMPDIVEMSTRMWPGYCLQVGLATGNRVKMYRIVNEQNRPELRMSRGRIMCGLTKIGRGLSEINVELARPGVRAASALGDAGCDLIERAVVELNRVEAELG